MLVRWVAKCLHVQTTQQLTGSAWSPFPETFHTYTTTTVTEHTYTKSINITGLPGVLGHGCWLWLCLTTTEKQDLPGAPLNETPPSWPGVALRSVKCGTPAGSPHCVSPCTPRRPPTHTHLLPGQMFSSVTLECLQDLVMYPRLVQFGLNVVWPSQFHKAASQKQRQSSPCLEFTPQPP